MRISEAERALVPSKQEIRIKEISLREQWNYWRKKWLQWSAYFDPEGLRLYDTSYHDASGSWRNINVINPVGTESVDTFSSGAETMMSSKANPWFQLAPAKRSEYGRSAADKANLSYSAELEEAARDSLADTNLYDVLGPCYRDLATYGYLGFLGEENADDITRYRHLAPGSYMTDLDWQGEPKCLWLRFPMNAARIAERFGRAPDGSFNIEHLPRRVRDALGTNQTYNRRFSVTLYIGPNMKKVPNDPGLAGQDFIATYYLDDFNASGQTAQNNPPSGPPIKMKGNMEDLLEYRGYDILPFFYAFWRRSQDDSYGHGHPADNALRLVKGIQHAEVRGSQATDFGVMPPFLGHSSLKLKNRDASTLLPGEIILTNDFKALEGGLKQLLQTNFRVDHNELKIGRYREAVRSSFFVDLILKVISLEKANITATEINHIVGERLLVLVPMYSKIERHVLRKVVAFHTQKMLDHGKVRTPPESMIDKDKGELDLGVRFVSILAQAQQFSGVDKKDRFLDLMAKHGNTFPEIRAKVKGAKFADSFASDFGIDPDNMLTDEELANVMAQNMERERAMAEAEQRETESRTLKNLSEAQGPEGESLGLEVS